MNGPFIVIPDLTRDPSFHPGRQAQHQGRGDGWGMPCHGKSMSDMNETRPIRPVILAGGAGTRLWPLSTVEQPKHLLPLIGDRSLFEQTLDRFGEHFGAPIIVANRAQDAELVRRVGSDATLILEPCKRDSAPAIALAALAVGEDELLLVCPSDHHIGDVAAFHTAIGLARACGRGRSPRDLRDRTRSSRDRLRLYRRRAKARGFVPSLGSSRSRRSSGPTR